MKSLISLLVLLIPSAVLAGSRQPIERASLDDHLVYIVPVATNRVTTISFPGPIAAIDAAGVTADPKIPGQFQLAHTKGSGFFSVRAQLPGATANVNVRWGKATYVFQLEESSQPVLSFNLDTKPSVSRATPAPVLTPARLLSLLDKTKSFPLLAAQHPEAVPDVEVITFAEDHPVSDFNDYEICLDEVFRFNSEDTLVFHLRLKNKIDAAIFYRPDSFALRVGNRVYPQSVSDAAGVIPPKSKVTAYFAVTGTPDGGRNELSLKNDFTIWVERILPVSTNQITGKP